MQRNKILERNVLYTKWMLKHFHQLGEYKAPGKWRFSLAEWLRQTVVWWKASNANENRTHIRQIQAIQFRYMETESHSISEVAEYLGVSTSSVYRYLAGGYEALTVYLAETIRREEAV